MTDKDLDQRLSDVLNKLIDDQFNPLNRYQTVVKAKQAITSLIKELVAEAKPLYYASPDKSEYQDGFNTCIRHYEQNLLKALEEL